MPPSALAVTTTQMRFAAVDTEEVESVPSEMAYGGLLELSPSHGVPCTA